MLGTDSVRRMEGCGRPNKRPGAGPVGGAPPMEPGGGRSGRGSSRRAAAVASAAVGDGLAEGAPEAGGYRLRVGGARRCLRARKSLACGIAAARGTERERGFTEAGPWGGRCRLGREAGRNGGAPFLRARNRARAMTITVATAGRAAGGSAGDCGRRAPTVVGTCAGREWRRGRDGAGARRYDAAA